MSHRTNAHPGPCAQCKASVAASAGTLIGPPWKVVCQACLPFPAAGPASTITIAITKVSAAQLEVAPSAKLGSASWGTYKGILDRVGVRARKDKEGAWHSLGPIACAPELVQALSDAGFVLSVNADVTAAVETQAEVATLDVAAADARVAQVDAQLAKRGKSLYPFQREGVAWLAPRAAALLADDPGTGKTVQTLAAIPIGVPALVICPSVAKGVWMRETKAWRPDLTPIKIDGRGRFRWPTAGELLIYNDEILPAVEIKTGRINEDGEPVMEPAPFLADCPAGLVVVHDECHRGKASGALRTQRVRALSKAARAAGGRFWGLSGTPLMNRAPDLWSVLQNAGLANEAFGSWFGFARAMGGRQEEIKARGRKAVKIWVWDGLPTSAAATALRRVMLRRTKDEVLPDLPAKTYKTVDVEIEDKALLAQLELLEEQAMEAGGWDAFLDHDDRPARSKEATIGFSEISATRARLAAAKIEAAIEVIAEYEDAGEPVVVFSAHRKPVEIIGARDGWRAIVGGMPAAQRTQIEDDFQAGRLKGVALTIGAGGVAITLTRASNAIFIDRSWTPAENLQAEDRIRRIGTTKAVQITDLVAEHPLDKQVTQLLIAKQGVVDASVEAARVGAGQHATNAAQIAASALGAIAGQDERLAAAAASKASYEAQLAALLAGLVAEEQAEEARAAAEKADPATVLERRIERAWTRFAALDAGEAHEACSPAELWAADALQQLAANDLDFAFEDNGVGFNKADCGIGHALARAAGAGLTDGGWRLAIKVASHYPGQVGRVPAEEAA